MIPEEEYPPSKSVTDTSQKQESKAVNNNISDMDLLREFEKQDPDDAKRRTQQLQTPNDKVSYQDQSYSENTVEEIAKQGLETRHRPRADEVMRDLELQMDLSEDQSQTITDAHTEPRDKMHSAGSWGWSFYLLALKSYFQILFTTSLISVRIKYK